MYTLYIANKNYSSWSLRPWVLLRELNIPFTERVIPFHDAAAWAVYRRIAPNGKVPCLIDGDTTVWESLAIAEYLAERHVGVWPTAPPARAWARSAAAEMHSGFSELRNRCGMSCGIRVRLNNRSAGLEADLTRISMLWNDGLNRFGGPFLAGAAFTAVDAFFAPVAFRVQSYDLKLLSVPQAYVARLLALPSMRDWYAQSLAEPWRDLSHDVETAQHGAVIEDLRAPNDASQAR